MQRMVRVPAALASVIAILAIAGYVANKAKLITLLPGWQGMSLLTAIGVVLLALPLWAPRLPRPGALRSAPPTATLALMLVVLLSHALFQGDIVSPWIAQALLDLPPALSGRVSVATASCMLMLSIATLATHSADRLAARFAHHRAIHPAAQVVSGRAVAVVELTSNVALLFGGAALLGYAYRVSDLYGIYLFNTMSPQSALAIVCIALAKLIAEPNSRLGMALRSPSLGVRQLRRMLGFTALPAVLGWLFLHGGAQIGNSNGAAMALLVMSTTVPMFYLLLENARALELLDRERGVQQAIERRFTDDLQHQVTQQTAALADSHRREVASLAQAERARRADMIAQLTGNIAHDFNNLLMVIGGSAQLLKLRMRGDTASAPLVDKIAATVTGAAKLTGQLAAFSRTQRLETVPVHIDSVVRAVLAGTPPPAGVTLVTDLHADEGMTLSDSGQLQIALAHLIRNAWEAVAGEGSVTVSTMTSAGANGHQQVVLRVTDSGTGMTQDQIDNAVEPFFTTKGGSHHGLGLAQVNSVVHQASGSMHIASQPGQGTTVELCLPCIAAEMELQPATVTHTHASVTVAGKRRLLVIDDDDEVRAVLVALLRQMNYEVTEASDGETGLRLLAQYEPAAAIIDYLMPGMNGAEVARRARLASPALPIIFISGYADSNAIDAIPRSKLLRKPVMVEELAQTVAGALVAA